MSGHVAPHYGYGDREPQVGQVAEREGDVHIQHGAEGLLVTDNVKSAHTVGRAGSDLNLLV